MLCTQCGSHNDASEKKCVVCGKLIEQSVQGNSDIVSAINSSMEKSNQAMADSTTHDQLSNTQVELYKAILGSRNQNYYLKKFARFDGKGKAGISWNWSAFWLTFCWLIYRRMAVRAILYFVMQIVYFILLLVVVIKADKNPDMLLIIGSLFYIAAALLLPASYANAIYYKHCKKVISKTRSGSNSFDRQLGELSGKGGTNNFKLIATLYLIFSLGVGALVVVAALNFKEFNIRSNIDTDEVLSHVAKDLFEFDLTEWTLSSNGPGKVNTLRMSIVGDCSEKAEPHNCEPEPPMQATLDIMNHDFKTVSNDTGIEERYAAFVQLGYEVLPEYTDNTDRNNYKCALLVRTKMKSVWSQEYLGVVNEETYTGMGRAVHDCSGYDLTWDEAGYPVLKSTITTGPYIGGVYSTADITIHLVNGTYQLESEVVEERSNDDAEKSDDEGSDMREDEDSRENNTESASKQNLEETDKNSASPSSAVDNKL